MPIGGSSYYTLTPIEKLQAHRHVLTNCPIVDDYLKQYRSIARSELRSGARSTSEVDKKVHREFARWFRNRICNNLDTVDGLDKDILISLAQGPFDKVRRFTAYNVNGFKFRTLARDTLLKTQNSGVFGMFGTRSYSSNSDAQMRFGGEMARKNAVNRAKLKLNHSLGTKSIARTQQELEKRDGRKYSRGEMFAVSHKKSDGSFVNDEAKKKNDQLQAEIAKTHSENEAFVNVFGKEHGGFARSMGLGVTPSQLTTTCSARLTSSSENNEKMKKMQAEIDSLTEKASQVDILKEQVAFLMQMHNSKDNQEPFATARYGSPGASVPLVWFATARQAFAQRTRSLRLAKPP
ncbi:unnamed protein product [Trifolium pratense]|uniref:Uncharacterized protein n=1 Tax=Trifolium pratense TaxID=57577 RepID=A0ACB0IZR2_TRIPR|nr:unnamed protein product [Trifolium pratense]